MLLFLLACRMEPRPPDPCEGQVIVGVEPSSFSAKYRKVVCRVDGECRREERNWSWIDERPANPEHLGAVPGHELDYIACSAP